MRSSAVLFAVVLVAAVAVAMCRAAEVEAETDPHRLLSDKREKLRVVTAKLARDAAEAPLQEFEITDAGVTEVKTVPHDTKGVPKSVYYTSASSSGAAAGAALEHTVLMAVSETIRAHVPGTENAKPVASQPLLLQTGALAAPAAPAAPAPAAAAAPAATSSSASTSASAKDVPPAPVPVNGLSADASDVKGGKKAPSRAALRKAAKRKAKGTLKCQCTFQPLPDKMPPLTPDQKNPKGAAEKEKKREEDLLKKLTAGKQSAAPAPAPAAAAAPAVAAATAAAAPAAASGTVTPLKFVETSARAAPTELATNADSGAAGAAPLFNAAYHADDALTDAAFVELNEAVDADADADVDAEAEAEAEAEEAALEAEDVDAEAEQQEDGADETEADA